MKIIITLKISMIALLCVIQVFAQQTPSENSIYNDVLPVLRKKTKVPLRLPTYLAAEEETNPLYAIVEKASANRYELQIAFTADCEGGACHYGTLSGEIVRSKNKFPRGRAARY